MSVMSDVRNYADTALDQGKSYASAAGDDARQLADTLAAAARKQAFAVVGAGEIAVSAVGKRVERIPAQAQKAVADARGITTASARSTVDAYVAQARNVFESLAEHGEKVVQKLRTDPRVDSVKAKVDLAGADVAELSRPAPARSTQRKATGRRAATKATAAKRTRSTSAK